MLIIIEGPDLVGKSTLAAEIQAYIAVKFPGDVVTLLHKGPPTQHPLHEYVTPLLDYIPGREHIICDRWHLGELVYPYVTGRKTKMSRGVFRYVEAFLAKKGALLVYMNADDQTITQRYAARGDSVQTLERVIKASRTYDVAMRENTLPYRRTMVASVEQIVKSARNREIMSRDTPATSRRTYVGSPWPMTLYVGDVRGCSGIECRHKPEHDPRFPAFGPFPNTCGEFLMNCLPEEFGWGLVNVNDVDGVYSDLGAQEIVALGRLAHRTLKEYGVPHTVVPHPQYVKRFHNKEVDEYRRLLTLRDREDHVRWRS